MSRLNFSASDYNSDKYDVALDENHIALAMQSYHPTIAVNNTECRPEYRALLIHHFLAAFIALSCEVELPDYVKDLHNFISKKGNRERS